MRPLAQYVFQKLREDAREFRRKAEELEAMAAEVEKLATLEHRISIASGAMSVPGARAASDEVRQHLLKLAEGL